jgi:HSP20 family protein
MSLSIFSPSNRFFEDDWFVSDPLFSSLIHQSSASQARANKNFNSLAPILTADLIESETDFRVHADLPGVDPSDLELTVEGKSLLIKAERKHVHKTGTDKVHSLERTYGKVQRSIRLPANVDVDNIQTTFRQGVLSITIPKVEPVVAAVKKLKIDSA